MSGHLCLKWNNHSTAFIKSISSIQIKERYCDATIVCQGRYFPVHRVVLSTCSDYFDEMFERMQCQHPYIVFKDIDPKEMELLLNYMYQGEVNVLQENLPTLIKAAEALKVKGLAVPDDLPSKESSGRKRGSSSNDIPVPKRRSEEKRRRRDSSDQTPHDSTSSNHSQNREKLDNNIQAIENKLIKEEPLDTGYNDPPLSTDYREAAYSGSNSSVLNTNEPNLSNEPENNFASFPTTEETKSFVKQEQTEAGPSQTFCDEQSSSWGDFAGDDILHDLPPETSQQDDIYDGTGTLPRSFYPTTLVTNKGVTVYSRSHRCPHCDYRSSGLNKIKRHIRYRHTGERPFQCSFCSKSFVDHSGLQVHERIHTGEKPFECSICSAKFTQKVNLLSHMKRNH